MIKAPLSAIHRDFALSKTIRNYCISALALALLLWFFWNHRIARDTVSLSPVAGDFAGLWRKYIGTDGVGTGDMLLNATQTVTGPKSFSNGALRILNAGATARSTLRFSGDADRDHYLPAKAGTLRLQPLITPVAYAATMALDFDVGTEWQEIALTGDVSFTLANAAAGKVLVVRIMTDDSARAITWPAFNTYGLPLPTTLGANDELLVVLRATGATAAHILATPIVLNDAHVSYAETTLSGTGSTAVATPARRKVHSHLFTVSDEYGGGAWTHKVYFAVAAAVAGDRVLARVSLPDSIDPTVEFRDASATGTVLLSLPSKSFETEAWALFVFDGTAWGLEWWDWRTTDGALVQNLFTRGTTTYAATVNVDLDGPAYQQITATGDLTLGTLSTSRAGTGRAKSVSVLVTASGGDRAIAFASGVKGIGDTLPSGKTAAVCLLSAGANESDTLAAYAQLD